MEYQGSFYYNKITWQEKKINISLNFKFRVQYKIKKIIKKIKNENELKIISFAKSYKYLNLVFCEQVLENA